MKKVFIYSSHPLLGRGIEHLLRQETNVSIVGIETDLDCALKRVQELHPDLVIVDSCDAEATRALLVMRLLQDSGPCVVGINLQNNSIIIYHGESRVVKDVSDFVRAVQSE
jgi:DNA-binding NarL/FixJ family response regulator